MWRTVLSCYDVVAQIVESNPTIESTALVTYVEGPNWRDLPSVGEGASLARRLRGLKQDRGERVFTKVLRSEISANNLCHTAQTLRGNRLLGMCSRVQLVGGASAHIPMMDFMCPASPTNLELLVPLIKDLCHGRGCLLESGRSYHFYGFKLLTEEQWKVFLGKCLLMSGFADDRYIGHQLVDGHCVLRLSSGESKILVPRVVSEFL